MSEDNTRPLVSVIVTSYNHAEYLKQRMDSLLLQTYDNIEIIVVDDCSTDNSAAVLSQYQGNSKVRITIFDRNGGYAKACNYGVELSKGEYIMFAECDDFSDHVHVEMLMKILIKNDALGVAFCRSNMVDNQGYIFGDDFHYREKEFRDLCARNALIPQKEMQKYFLKSCVIPNMSAAIVRKKYFMMIGGLDSKYKACADWDFWCRMARHCDFYYEITAMNNFRTHKSTVRNTTAIGVSVLEIYDILYREYRNVHLSLAEKFKFKIAMGFVWAQFVADNYYNWFGSLPAIWIKTFKYDKFLILYMCVAMTVKSLTCAQRQLFGKTAIVNKRKTFEP